MSLLTQIKMYTAAEYDKAIADLELAKTQLKPDGRECVICGDGGHQAWECHHNPLAMHDEAWRLQLQWRCFHCGETFTNESSAREHFGSLQSAKWPKCIDDLLEETLKGISNDKLDSPFWRRIKALIERNK